MAKCLNCGKDVPQTPGKRVRLYCNEACKKAFQRKAKLSDNGTKAISGQHNGTGSEANKSIYDKCDWSKLTRDEQEDRWARIKAAGCVLTGGYQPTIADELPANFGQPDCQCMHCQQNRRSKHPRVINHGDYKLANELVANEINRVSLPGDVDYEGVCNDSKYDSRRF